MLALLVWASCGADEQDKKPPIGEEVMVRMLVDVQILEARADLTKLPADTIAPLVNEQYQDLYKKHGISEADFKTTMQFYEDHPKVLDGVYEKVIDMLTSKEAALKSSSEKKEKPKPADKGEGPKK